MVTDIKYMYVYWCTALARLVVKFTRAEMAAFRAPDSDGWMQNYVILDLLNKLSGGSSRSLKPSRLVPYSIVTT